MGRLYKDDELCAAYKAHKNSNSITIADLSLLFLVICRKI
jgi:hypothetical protein